MCVCITILSYIYVGVLFTLSREHMHTYVCDTRIELYIHVCAEVMDTQLQTIGSEFVSASLILINRQERSGSSLYIDLEHFSIIIPICLKASENKLYIV